MKNRIEVEKNSSGRIESGIVVSRGRKLKFTNEWDDDGFLSARTFEGHPTVLPSAVDMIRGIDQEFIERIRQIDVIDKIVDIQKIDEVHVANATVQNIVEGFNFTERWEAGFFDRKKYFGRTGPYFKSEAEEPPPYTIPGMVKNVNTLQVVPWNNAIHMINSKDGVTQDELYFAIPQAFKAGVLRIDALLPTNAQIAAADDLVAWGFEVCSQGGTAAIYVQGTAGGYLLCVNHFGPAGGIYKGVAVVPTKNAWAAWWLVVNLPMVRLIEYSAGVYTVLGELVLTEPGVGDFYITPFFCNESATNIVSNFYLGNISVWALGGRPLPAYVESTANTAFDVYIETMSATSFTLRIGVTVGTMIGNTSIYVSNDNATWSLVDTVVNGAVAYLFKSYNQYYHSATKPTNVPAWPFLKITMDAQGAGKIGRLEWSLK